jgi:hypothetical protein
MTAGQDEMSAHYLNGGVWSDQSNQRKGTKKYPNSGVSSIKEHSITLKQPHKWSWPIQTILIVFERYTNAAIN